MPKTNSRKIIVSIFLTFALLFLSQKVSVQAATYYVDSVSGNDSNNGITNTTAWQTISKVSNATFAAGDNILFKRGDTWREVLQLSASIEGTSGNPITFGAYGTGNNPIITGADLVTSWSVVSGSEYQATETTQPQFVMDNDTNLTAVGSSAAVASTAGSWYWSSNVLYVRTFDSTNPSGHTIESTVRDHDIEGYFLASNYITIDGLTLEHANAMCLQFWWGTGLTVQNSYLRNCLNPGVWVWEGDPAHPEYGNGAPNMHILNNTFRNTGTTSGSASLYINGDNAIVTGNTFYQCLSRCIDLTAAKNNGTSKNATIQHNQFISPGSGTSDVSGIALDRTNTPSNSNYQSANISYNLFKNGRGRFIDGWYGDSTIAYNIFDTVTAGNANSGIAIEVNGPNNKIYNNVIWNPELIGLMFNNDSGAPNVQSVAANNILASNVYVENIIYVANDSGVNPVFENNLYYPNGLGLSKYIWRSVYYNFTSWKTLSGETNAIESDPLFTSATSSNFNLLPGSPAIDHGTNVGLTQDFNGSTVPFGPAVDIGPLEWGPYIAPIANTGSGYTSAGCNLPAPIGNVNLFQFQSSLNSVKLFFTTAKANVTGYIIYYGYTPDDERFSAIVNYNGPLWVFNYTIDHLNPNTTYYFKIRPVNGCVGGPLSNVLPITTGKGSTVPTVPVQPTATPTSNLQTLLILPTSKPEATAPPVTFVTPVFTPAPAPVNDSLWTRFLKFLHLE